ncbi:MAG: hypothetical protein RQ899_01590 [Pseudomonadales bacterium]|nr:hypothetical protein [Pseudomonadales bacterium]
MIDLSCPVCGHVPQTGVSEDAKAYTVSVTIPEGQDIEFNTEGSGPPSWFASWLAP